VIRERLHARKPCGRAYERPPARSSAFGKLFPAAAVASKSRRLKSRPKSRPKSRGRPQSRGDRRFSEPFRPEPVVAQGQGRVDCRGRMPREHSSPRRQPQGREDQGLPAVAVHSRDSITPGPPFPVHSSVCDERK
jgi:hypothetical protein